MELEYMHGDEGRAFMAKGHVDLDEFRTDLLEQVDSDDPILSEDVSHCWMRCVRDFSGNHSQMLIEAKPGSRGAFKATWVQDN